MAKTIFQIADKSIKGSFSFLFFFVPLVLTPWNFELFEFNKMVLVYLFSPVIFASWLIKMIVTKKMIFKRTPLDGTLLLFLASQLLSTFFSIDGHTSVWGYYTRAHGGLLSTMAYLSLYWAFVSNFNRRQTLRMINKVMVAALLVAGYGILQHFGIDKNYWVQDVQNRVFSTLGQPNWLAAYLTVVIFIPIAKALRRRKAKGEKRKAKNLKLLTISGQLLTIIPYFLFTILYLCLLYSKSRSGLLAFGFSYLVFWLMIILINLNFLLNKKTGVLGSIFKKFFAFTLIVLSLTFATDNPLREKLIFKTPSPSSSPETLTAVSKSTEIRKVVWQGAIDIWKHYPFLGSGVETFAYTYYNFRPAEHNLLSEWDFLYNKAHNEYLNFLATTGIIGLGSYLILIIVFLIYSLRKIKNQSASWLTKDKNMPTRKSSMLGKTGTIKNSKFSELNCLHIALLAGFVSILITNFFGFSVVPVAILFFLLPAFYFKLTNEEKKEKVKISMRISYVQLLLSTAILLFTFYSLLFTFKLWYADFCYAQADRAYSSEKYQQAFNFSQKAIELHPKEPVYHDRLALSAAALAQLASLQKQATLSAQLVQLAVEQSDQTLEMNPYHLNFWKNRTRVFLRLSEIDPDLKLKAIESLSQAAGLAPTDAKIFYNLGLLYYQLDQKKAAIEILEKTINLRPNYKEARFALALYYYEDNQVNNAIEQLKFILQHIEPQDQRMRELIESWQEEIPALP